MTSLQLAMLAANPDRLHWSPTMPLVLILIIVLLASLMQIRAAGPAWQQRLWLLVPRCIVIGGIGILLTNPSATIPGTEPRPIAVTMLIDASESMSLPHETPHERCSRIEAIKQSWLSSDALSALRQIATVRFASFDSVTHQLAADELDTLEPRGATTDLTQAIEHALATHTPASPAMHELVILTDGADTTGQSLDPLISRATAFAMRIHAVVPPESQSPDTSDIRLEAWAPVSFVRSGEEAEIIVDIHADGYTDRPAELIVYEGSRSDGNIIASQPITLAPQSRERIAIRPEYTGSPGGINSRIYTAFISPFTTESDLTNNTAEAFLQVSSRRLRITLFEQEQSWDTRFFVSALADEPDVELTLIHGLERAADSSSTSANTEARITRLRSSPTGIERHVTREAPDLKQVVAESDLIVLGRATERLLGPGHSEILESFVRAGGSLLLLRGEAPAALESLAPAASLITIEESGEAILTSHGSAMRLAQLPADPAISLFAHAELQPQASAWLMFVGNSDSWPLLAAMPVGLGSVAQVYGHGFWRWDFAHEAADSDGSADAGSFWRAIVHRLTGQSSSTATLDLSVALDRTKLLIGEPLQIQVTCRARDQSTELPVLSMIDPNGAHREILLTSHGRGRWRASIQPDTEGIHTLSLESISATGESTTAGAAFRAERDVPEFRDTAPRPETLKPIVQATSGRFFALDDPSSLLKFLNDERTAATTQPRSTPAWDRPWVFIVIIAMLLFEWHIRRRGGLA